MKNLKRAKNLKLKAKIVEHFETQNKFCRAIGEHEAVVSRIINGVFILPEEERGIWAKALKCDPDEIFPQIN